MVRGVRITGSCAEAKVSTRERSPEGGDCYELCCYWEVHLRQANLRPETPPTKVTLRIAICGIRNGVQANSPLSSRNDSEPSSLRMAVCVSDGNSSGQTAV